MVAMPAMEVMEATVATEDIILARGLLRLRLKPSPDTLEAMGAMPAMEDMLAMEDTEDITSARGLLMLMPDTLEAMEVMPAMEDMVDTEDTEDTSVDKFILESLYITCNKYFSI